MGAMRKTLFTLVSFRLLLWASMETLKVSALISMTNGTNIAKPGCSSKCGKVTIPYPFGFGDLSCSLNQNYHVYCDQTYNPAKPLMRGYDSGDTFEILGISENQLRIRNQVAIQCYNSSGGVTTSDSERFTLYGFPSESPFSFSADSNRLTTIGCSSYGVFYSKDSNRINQGSTTCNSDCPTIQKVVAGSCKGAGCCEAIIAEGSRSVNVFLMTNDVVFFDHCNYAFLAEKGTFTFRGLPDFSDPNFVNRTIDHVPVAIDWVIGNMTCNQARKQQNGSSSYVCQANTACSDYSVSAIGGYTCSCLPGYQGNPYLSPGCSDIDECASGVNNCSHSCHNQPGNYSCLCPPGYVGDGMKNGTSCTKKSPSNNVSSSNKLLFTMKLALAIGSGLFCLVLAGIVLYFIKKRLQRSELKKDCFRKNGGMLLQELLSSTTISDNGRLKIFTQNELKTATENFSDDQVLGKGGHGIVYKGVLSNNQVVAVKKSKAVDQGQIEEFINEMVILGQISHTNVVKIVGCCLESEVPMLVYEYISNGTLFDHIHSNKEEHSWLDWSNCIRIATEAASALAHLHSSVSIPIIHRDVKSSNILIDENYTAKMADFGASRLIPLDQTRLSTIVQGTLGYLDPEYYYSGHITEKSDVYSFAIVLIELLTKQKPISEERDVAEATLSTYFIRSVQAGKFLNILDPQIVEEAPIEQLSSLVDLILKCLSPKGEGRPTMMNVLVELKAIKTCVSHPFVPQNQPRMEIGHNSSPQDETISYPEDMISRSSTMQDEETDLYPVPFKPK